MLEEIYLLYVSNTYHMNFECVCVHLYLLEAAMLYRCFISNKIDHFDEFKDEAMKFEFFLGQIIHIEHLTNAINTMLWCIWVYLGVFW